MIHDGARPSIDENLINRVWDAKASGCGVIPGMKVGDTVKKVRASEAYPHPVVERTVPRTDLVLVQTPQLFEKEILFSGYSNLSASEVVTDEAALYEKLGRNVIVVPGAHDNLKVTFAEDLERVSSGLRSRHPPF